MGGQRRKLGAKKIAELARALGGTEKVAKKLKVSASTVRRWRREGVPEARRRDVARVTERIGGPSKTRPPTPRKAPRKIPEKAPQAIVPPAAPARPLEPRNIKWRDERGRWRNRNGSFTSPPHRKKTEWPRPRKGPPPPKPPKKKRKLGPPALPPEILHPKKGDRFPKELLEAFEKERWIIGSSAGGALIVLPSSVEELAEKIGRKPNTIKRWIQKDRVPPDDLANLRAILRGARPHGIEDGVRKPYASGDRKKWTKEEWEELKRVGEEFKRAWEENRAGVVYPLWRAVKDKIRGALTKKVWRKLMEKLGKAIGLADTGRFSVEMWRMS